MDVVVIGAGPAGVLAAIRAADLGARTTLVSSAEFGGMAANDGPVPIRALAYAARLVHEARHLPRYGITVGEFALQYDELLARVGEVVRDVRARSPLRERIDALGVTVYERVGAARFVDPHTIETEHGPPAAGGEADHLHRRCRPSNCRPRLRAHAHAQRRMGVDRGARVDAGRWCREHGSADRFHVPRVWHQG
jgi:pyruvate/2-oxoglutarate dehydrogenase complex dihydrolipoamide dehydrogenase (E3) component